MAFFPSTLWASLLAWFTPTSLFFFLNLTIFTLVLSQRFNNNKNPNQQQYDQLGLFDSSQQLVRAPSLLDRVRSINFSNYKYQQPDPEPDHVMDHPAQDNPTGVVRTPSLLTRLKSMEFSSIYKSNQPDPVTKALRPTGSPDPNPRRDHLVHRSKSDRESPETRPEKVIKKSASEKSKMKGVEEKDNISVRPRRMEHTTSFGDDEGEGEGVDAKCDDFINRFKQQLKLQRLDSLLRYKEMLKRN